MRSRHVAILLSIGAIACKDLPTAPNRSTDWQPAGGVSSSASLSGVAILDLGTLQAGTPATALDINNDGYVVGFSGHFPTYCCGFIVDQPHGFLWTQASGMRDIGVSMRAYGGGINSRATAISGSGLIAGHAREAYWDNNHYLITGQASDILTGPPWQAPYPPPTWSMTVQGLFAPVYSQITTALDVNEAGVVVGTGDDGLTGAFMWTAASGFTTLATLGPGSSAATGIDDAGQIVGWGTVGGSSRPFRWAPGTLAVESLGLPSGWTGGRASGLNASGRIAGFGRDASGSDRGFVWDPATLAFTVLGTLGGPHSYAYAINADGVVVGASTTASGALHAFAWDPTSAEMLDLGALSGDTQSEARAINDHGQVAGRSFGAGMDHAVLWTVTLQHNAAPTAAPGGPYAGAEGSEIAFTGLGSTDPDNDALTYAWNFGDGSTGTGGAPTHFYTDNGTYSVTLTVTDEQGVSSVPVSTAAIIANVAPTITGLTLPTSPVPVGSPVALAGSFTDPSTLDTHGATVDWADGAGAVSAVVNQSARTVSASRTFSTAGVYAVTLVVADDDGGSAIAVGTNYVVVYDPSAGFVTGGGWITSPERAYSASPTLTGKASFGFVSRYKKGATTPSGNTEFQFHAASFEFSSSTFQWLVVAGARAQFKGTGAINGAGTYGFLISAVDGQVNGGGGTDRFRIKIWEVATGTVVYDNQMDAADDMPASTALGGGSIVIHP